MNRLPNAFHGWAHRFLTLRTRLIVWCMVVLATTSIAFVLAVNMTARALVPDMIITIPLRQASPENDDSAEIASGAPSSVVMEIPVENSSPVIKQILDSIGAIAFIAMGIGFVIGVFGAYYLMGFALRPILALSREIATIDSKNLKKRLSYDGPADEVKQLADAFDRVLERLERSFERQSQFAADAAHELRTPLATLRANLEVVHSDGKAALDDYHEMATSQEQVLSRLEQLVSDLLLLTQERYEDAGGTVSLTPLLEEIVADMSAQAERLQVELVLDAETEIILKGNDVLLTPIFRNLIENGIRYNRPGGKVEVFTRFESDWAVIVVADTGIGIPPEKQELVLERFYRLRSSRSRREGGSGLGLAIVSHLVSLHEGRLDVESSPGVGSRFIVRLPNFTQTLLPS